MADALARFGPTAPGTSASTLITAGGDGAFTAVRNIHLVNTSASSAWITLGVNGVLAANSIFWQELLEAGEYFDWTGNIPLLGSSSTPDTLQAIQQTSGSIVVTIGAVTGP